MSAEVNFDIEAFMRRVSAANDDAVCEAARVGAEKAQELVSRGVRWVSSAPGRPPSKQAGILANSIAYVHPSRLGTPGQAAFGTGVKHGAYLENGANPRAKGKALPVPCNVQAEMMLARLGGVSLRTQKLAPREKNGKKYLVEMTASGKKEKKNGAVFVLRKSVTIKPRPWLLPARNQAGAEMGDVFKKVFREKSGIAPPGALK